MWSFIPSFVMIPVDDASKLDGTTDITCQLKLRVGISHLFYHLCQYQGSSQKKSSSAADKDLAIPALPLPPIVQ
ncbi:hypothetical protein RRF57_009955 [Xylaria bambusicola]|uniref:Uncharacterized protein n=1 Tax=Xylaria bambusicola TaxID=326684 RepID=A0AAN7UXL6_9PEZI